MPVDLVETPHSKGGRGPGSHGMRINIILIIKVVAQMMQRVTNSVLQRINVQGSRKISGIIHDVRVLVENPHHE